MPHEIPLPSSTIPRGDTAARISSRIACWMPHCALAVCALLIAWLYRPLAANLWFAWSTDANYSHGPLVVLAAIALAFSAARRLPRFAGSGTAGSGTVPIFVEQMSLSVNRNAPPAAPQYRSGVLMMVASLLLHAIAWLMDFTLLDAMSLVGLLLALLLLKGGNSLRREMGFAVLLLLFAVPLPLSWYQPLALAMQKLVSGLAATILSLCGLSVYREGYVIHLSGLTMEVGAACSGMRQLTAYLALGAVVGHLARRGRGFTLALMGLAVVAAIGANLLRILLTTALLLVAGRTAAEGVFHTLEGLATLAIGAVGLMAAAVILARVHDRLRHGTHHAPRDANPHAEREEYCRVPLAPPVPSRRAVFNMPHEPVIPGPHRNALAKPVVHERKEQGPLGAYTGGLMILGTVILGTAAWVQLLAERAIAAAPVEHAASLSAELATLPRELGPWQGVDVPPPPDVAWADQYLRRNYRHRQTGQVVMVWIAYSQTGADRTHHPEICMDVAGRAEDRNRRAELPRAGGAPIAELVFGRPGEALHTWYWHYALPDARQPDVSAVARLYHRARSRRASVSVELISSDDSAAGREAARELVAQIDEALRPLLPAGAVCSSQRLPVGLAGGVTGNDKN